MNLRTSAITTYSDSLKDLNPLVDTVIITSTFEIDYIPNTVVNVIRFCIV